MKFDARESDLKKALTRTANRAKETIKKVLSPSTFQLEQDLNTLNGCAKLLNSTANAEIFFSRYELYMEKLTILAHAEANGIEFKGEGPREKLESLNASESTALINGFIDRFWDFTVQNANDSENNEQIIEFENIMEAHENKMTEDSVYYYKNKLRSSNPFTANKKVTVKCPKCGESARKSMKDPSYWLCDQCRVRFKYKGDDNKISDQTANLPELSMTLASGNVLHSNNKFKPSKIWLIPTLVIIGLFIIIGLVVSRPKTATVINVANMTADAAEKNLKEAGFKKILLISETDGSSVTNPENWIIVTQIPAAETEAKLKDEIKLYCRMISSISDPSAGAGNPNGQAADPQASSTNSSYPKQMKATATLNVRSGAGTNYDSVGTLYENDVVEVQNISDGWAQISYNGNTAYVSAQYLSE